MIDIHFGEDLEAPEPTVTFEERVAHAASDYETLDAEWIVGLGVEPG